MKLSFIFPGQGSQYVGMGRKIYESFPQVRDIFEQASDCLGINLTSLCFDGPEEELSKTVNAQPAILTVSVAYLKLVTEYGLTPDGAAGHSLGEYSALVAAGSLGFEDAVKLVRQRGRFMQEAVSLGRGGMAAVIGLDIQSLRNVCSNASARGIVEAVNINSPGQVVIAGENEALDYACHLARELGAKRCIKLPVSAPFHSSLMRPAGERLARELEKVSISDPQMPVVGNVNANYLHSGVEIKHALTEQVYSPVRWQESMEKMIQGGFTAFLEIGPGKVLTGLMRKINRRLNTFSIDSEEELEAVLKRVKEVLNNDT